MYLSHLAKFHVEFTPPSASTGRHPPGWTGPLRLALALPQPHFETVLEILSESSGDERNSTRSLISSPTNHVTDIPLWAQPVDLDMFDDCFLCGRSGVHHNPQCNRMPVCCRHERQSRGPGDCPLCRYGAIQTAELESFIRHSQSIRSLDDFKFSLS